MPEDNMVIIMTKNRYINASYLCKQNNKEFKHWKENSKSIELEDKLDTIIKTSNELITKNDILLTSNTELLSKNNEILYENHTMKKILEKNQLKLDKTFDKLVGVNEELRDVKDKLDDTNNKLNTATNDRVVKTKTKNEYMIILKTDDPEEKYKYYIIRCQKRNINQQLYEKPNFTEIKRIICPNANNLFNRIKEKLNQNLDIRYNRLNLKEINEKLFLKKIDEINLRNVSPRNKSKIYFSA